MARKQDELEPAGLANVHAERTILGAMLVEPDAVTEALDNLTPGAFALDSHRRLFACCRQLHAHGQSVDIVTTADLLGRQHALDSVGGNAWLVGLTEGLPRRLSITSYIAIVIDRQQKRETVELADLLTVSAMDGAQDARAILTRGIESMREIVEDHPDYDLESVGQFFAATENDESQIFDDMASVGAIRSGFSSYDEALGGGFQRGELIIVAARPSMGKSAWAANVAHHAAVFSGITTVLFALEQSRSANIRRMLSAATRVDHKDIRNGTLSQRDKDAVLEHRRRMAEAPLYIDDTSGLTVSRIRAKCMRLHARMTPAQREQGMLVLVDQLSHVSGADVAERGMQMREIVGKQTKGFKSLAKKDLGCPVVVFNQLSRDVGKRHDPTPRLEDLKESGNIEEDADVVTFLHRPEYYDKADESLKGKGQFIIAKNREGETKTVDCAYQGRIMRWEDDSAPAAKQAAFTRHVDPYYDSVPF